MIRAALLSLAVLAAALLTGSMAADSAPAANMFNFYDYLPGEWDVLKSDIDLTGTASVFTHSDLRGKYIFYKDNSTTASTIVGRYYDNDTATGIIENELAVTISFDDSSSGGHWAIGAEGDAPNDLFHFDFELVPGGHPTAAGAWNSAEPASYVLQITQPDKFTITVTPKSFGTTSTQTVYSLKKKLDTPAKTFFQQYGTYLMLGGFFIVNMYLKTKSQQWAQTSTAATAAAPAPASQVQAKKTK